MTIEAIAPVGTDSVATTMIRAMPQATDFMGIVGSELASVNASLQEAQTQLTDLAAGKSIAVHDVMIAMEEARTNMMLLVEIRNRVIEAYQELTRMQL